MNTLLPKSFYLKDALHVAPRLLGQILVRKINNTYIRCKIVEVEAYIGPDDKGAHVYNNKRTPRTEALFLPGGHTYIYLIYGMYNCLNIVTGKENMPQGVLIRAAQPIDEISLNIIKQNRNIKSKKDFDLTNGPGKLCAALKIDKTLNKYNVISGEELFLEKRDNTHSIVCAPRINIPYAEEYIHVPWRYYIKDNPYVSIIDPNAKPYNI